MYVMVWAANMAISSAVGGFRMRRYADVDWHTKFLALKREDPENTDALHFVIIPNFKEDEKILKETIENLGCAPMARSSMRIVLAMENREGPGVEEKANRLIALTSHLFAGISATFHPADLPGEVAGKSSNTQWAYQKVLQVYDSEVRNTFDPSRVFLTVMDADAIFHPQYFSCLSYQGMTMSKEARVWRMWQPPVFLLRNFFSVPAVTRLSGLATILFELAGLTNQYLGSHITFSCYSVTLALAVHAAVGGWDPDVIAEDHHMFVKCYFAPLWEAALKPNPPLLPAAPIKPKVQLDPIYLPALCYMAESANQEFWSSIKERFTQARRHSQGIAELSYCFLQYIRLCKTVGFFTLPFRTHMGIIAIIQKMFTVHVTNAVQATSLVLAALVTTLPLVMWVFDGGLDKFLAGGAGFFTTMGVTDIAWYAICSTIGPTTPIFMLTGGTTFLVVRDSLDGRYDCEQARFIQNNPAKPKLTFQQSLSLMFWSQYEIISCGEPTILLFGMIPELMAAWSLIWRGTAFEYIVAAKPVDKGKSID
jgi:hypothetical protein